MTTAAKSKPKLGVATPDGYTVRSTPPEFHTRALKTLDESTRSVDWVIVTEEPVRVYDWERGGVINEVLLATGVTLPKNKQVPLLDSHQRWTLKNQIGSVREIRVEGQLVIGRAFFSSTADGQEAFTKVQEGHVTDGSGGYLPMRSEWIPEGQKKIIQGKEYVGPLKVTTKWLLKELSPTPIGADERAKARSAYNDPQETDMSEEQTPPASEAPASAGAPGAAPSPAAAPAARSLPELPEEQNARRLEAVRKSVEAITPKGMEEFAARCLLEGKDFEATRQAILAESARRMTPAGTPPPVETAPATPATEAKAPDNDMLRAFCS